MPKDYQNELNRAKKKYLSIGSLMCPAIGSRIIYFKDDGFRHFLKKQGAGRSKNDQLRRFGLVSYIHLVVTSDRTYVADKRNMGKSVYIGIMHDFSESYSVKIIIRKINDGNYHFVSIMDKQK